MRHLWKSVGRFASRKVIELLEGEEPTAPTGLPESCVADSVFSAESTGVAVAFAIWSLLVNLIDNVLKPIPFGRGARVPMVVIFVDGIRGTLAMGIIGLFVGAVVLALGYQILMAWLSEAGPEAA